MPPGGDKSAPMDKRSPLECGMLTHSDPEGQPATLQAEVRLLEPRNRHVDRENDRARGIFFLTIYMKCTTNVWSVWCLFSWVDLWGSTPSTRGIPSLYIHLGPQSQYSSMCKLGHWKPRVEVACQIVVDLDQVAASHPHRGAGWRHW